MVKGANQRLKFIPETEQAAGIEPLTGRNQSPDRVYGQPQIANRFDSEPVAPLTIWQA